MAMDAALDPWLREALYTGLRVALARFEDISQPMELRDVAWAAASQAFEHLADERSLTDLLQVARRAIARGDEDAALRVVRGIPRGIPPALADGRGTEGALQSLAEYADSRGGTGVVELRMHGLRDVLLEIFKEIEAANARGRRITGIATGFDRYDRMTSGLHDGELTIVAARPGMGKTSLVLNMAVNVASPQQVGSAHDPNERWEEPSHGVVFFSLEMPREQIVNRMLCSEATLDVSRVRTGMLTPNDWSKLTQAASHLGSLSIWVDDTPALGLLELRSKVRRLQASYDRVDEATGHKRQRIGLIVVDDLELMTGGTSEVARGLKQLALELHVPIVAVSGLDGTANVVGESRLAGLRDLRQRAGIERAADTICFIHREDYFDSNSTLPGIAELIVAKQGHGPTDTVRLRFDAQFMRFHDLAEQSADDPV
jgi:replicative DNA helicase